MIRQYRQHIHDGEHDSNRYAGATLYEPLICLLGDPGFLTQIFYSHLARHARLADSVGEFLDQQLAL